jgi:phenylalanine-4-hydroxylase
MATPAVSADFTIDQNWAAYGTAEHAIWRHLFERQGKLLQGRATPEFLDGIDRLGVAAEGIPDFRRLNEVLDRATGWRIVAVPGLVPDDIFFGHLANRRFPSTCFIRKPEQIDYIEEPDVFHDIFGHVPLLVNPVFADYMQAYGAGGLKALGLGSLKKLARLYWYTVEFGLIRRPEGLRIYGSGIVSSKGESIAQPNRLRSAAHHAHELSDRRLPGDLFRDRRLRAIIRGDPARLHALLRLAGKSDRYRAGPGPG